jgi:hypothetical protein
MVIDYVLMGSTLDPLYFDFWPVVSKVWKEKFNIIPVLGLISDRDTDMYKTEYGFVKEFKAFDDINVGSQSQIVRMYLSKYLNGNCIISDIDIIPLSRKYFIDDINDYNDNDILVMSSHHYQTKHINQYPMCYVIGNSKNFDELFNTNLDWYEFIKKVDESSENKWFSDQVFLYNSINAYDKEKIKFPYRSFINDRVDRSYWNYNVDLLKDGHYIDSHSLRPYNSYKQEIDNLIELI